jgi:hypothetical protein
MARTLAMVCSFLRDTADLPSVFGFDVAVNGIVQALLQYSSYDRFIFFHPPGQPTPVELRSLMVPARYHDRTGKLSH